VLVELDVASYLLSAAAIAATRRSSGLSRVLLPLSGVFLMANASRCWGALVGVVTVSRVMLAAKRSNEQADGHA
jgi:hypothetical protein